MSRLQRHVAVGAIVGIAVTLLFPPFYSTAPAGNIVSNGYAFLLALPRRATVNVPLLLVEWLALLIIGGLVCLIGHKAGRTQGTGSQRGL